MTDRDIMQQALDALEIAEVDGNCCYEATELLRTRLAQPEQEPVLETVYKTIIRWDEGGGKRSRRELARRIVALYTSPPQRKPLTDEMVVEVLGNLRESITGNVFLAFARAIEAAHGIKERNT